jgi:hypothetical protein
MTPTEIRLALIKHGYIPIPLFGKTPAPEQWQRIEHVSPGMIMMWAKTWPDARNTGVLTRLMPALDIDILNPDAAIAIEELVRERFEERGWFLVRIGKPPKRAIVFRTITPFRKITSNLAHGGRESGEKLELLCDGQQLVVDGIHPETRKAYTWFGGEPWRIRRDELPYIHEHEARQLIADATSLLTNAHGYTHTAAAPKSNGGIRPGNGGEALWKYHLDNIRHGRALHDSLCTLAAMLAASGMSPGAAKHLLCALGEQVEPYDARVETRLRDIPRAIDSAYAKYSKR